MNKKNLLVVVCIGISLLSFSQSTDYARIKPYVDSISNIKYKTYEELAAQFRKTGWSDIEKAGAVYYWIATNIDYDMKGYTSGQWRFLKFDSTLARVTYEKKRGVCSGYSTLLKYMCDIIGVETAIITGYVKKEDNPHFVTNAPNHVWNAIKVNNVWCLVDVTWARTANEKTKCDDYYFLVNPNEFIANHYPEDYQWQLLCKPISKVEFDNYPYISSIYFELGFNEIFPKEGKLQIENNKVSFSIEVPQNYSIILKVFDNDVNKWVVPKCKLYNEQGKINATIMLEDEYEKLLRVDVLSNDPDIYEEFKGVLYYTLTY